MPKFKLGCDPEMFLADVTGKLIASCGKIGGSKDMPMRLPLGDGFAVQEDNVAIEFNIPPASNAKEYIDSISRTISFLDNEVKQMGLHIVNLSAASFDKDQLEHPAAQEFGCDPDFNAWTRKRNPRPKAEDETLRSCGGHVHVGVDDVDRILLIKNMDLYLGVPSIIMDKGEQRKQLYGKGGAHRMKPYGVEYRTLSNFWVYDGKLIEWVWNNTERALKATEASFAIDEHKDDILEAIDNNNKDVAMKLIKKFNLEVVGV